MHKQSNNDIILCTFIIIHNYILQITLYDLNHSEKRLACTCVYIYIHSKYWFSEKKNFNDLFSCHMCFPVRCPKIGLDLKTCLGYFADITHNPTLCF